MLRLATFSGVCAHSESDDLMTKLSCSCKVFPVSACLSSMRSFNCAQACMHTQYSIPHTQQHPFKFMLSHDIGMPEWPDWPGLSVCAQCSPEIGRCLHALSRSVRQLCALLHVHCTQHQHHTCLVAQSHSHVTARLTGQINMLMYLVPLQDIPCAVKWPVSCALLSTCSVLAHDGIWLKLMILLPALVCC